MSFINILHEIVNGFHVFPQPSEGRGVQLPQDSPALNIRAEDGFISETRLRTSGFLRIFSCLVAIVLLQSSLLAQTAGRIAGSVKDPSGAVVPGGQVVLLNPSTGVKQTTVSDSEGNFTFPVVSVGTYELDVTANGFVPYRQTQNLNVEVKTALNVDVVLLVAGESQTVEVVENTARVETADTQVGQTIESQQVTDIPLNGRSYTDLLAVQAGVAPVTTSGATNSSSGGGFGTVPAGGQANTGEFSIHGQRESDNAYYLNGVSVQETIGQQAGVIPNLDSIAEFRILSSNVDAEYGGFTGGVVNVVTKSGANQFHGNLFEFLRHTNLDARNYFSPERSAFHQNQYGGTLGGPIRKNKLFFFADYQGQRYIQGIETGVVTIPSELNRTGNFTDSPAFSGTVNGTYLAQLLSSRLGTAVTVGEPYSQVFPGNVIPQSAWGPTAQLMMRYIPVPNQGTSQFSTGAHNLTINDDKGAARIDFDSQRIGKSSLYYFNDNYTSDNPYPAGFGGASLPGNGMVYDATSAGSDQVIALDNIRTFGANMVNEARLGVTRLDNHLGEPKGGVGVSLADQGIQSSGEGIIQGYPGQAGVELMYFNGFSVGTNPFSVVQVNSNYDLSDSLSRTIGNHTLKAGGRYIWFQVKQTPNLVANGTFSFFASGLQTTGNDFADFLLGTPDFYSQQSSPTFYERAADGDLFVEDSYRVRSDLTLNYGLRWDYLTPWS
ncbi:MAG TPA: carboxypeptidase regulatory-like domain-containing protein, partial [Terriglobales bacterium]|nr:carboxypeptidase regulatory-like domain-containing protein [Terriglobales bacterium]